ncbi:MAG: MvdC/MvdD family ATP grasp protein [Bacteroidota bacterium]
MSKVLLLTHSQDYYVTDMVATRLQTLGYTPVRYNGDDYPTEWVIHERVGTEGFSVTWESDHIQFTDQEVAGVWNRKLVGAQVVQDMDPAFVQTAEQEASAVQQSALLSLMDCPWIDRPERVRAGEDKLRQLRLAQSQGLTVPETLITSDPDAVRAFYHAQQGEVVTKMMTALAWSMEGDAPHVYTSRVTVEVLDQMDSLRLCPMTFQRAIPKDYEVRVAYVGGRCFAGKIDASQTVEGQTDWKRAKQGTPWQACSLPDSVTSALHGYMQALGLHFGAIDLIKLPEGGYVFLEVNPAGEWGMLQKELDLPIGEAIADHLHHLIEAKKTT